ncbi:MAG: FKBP-type peptidyl-prolyl cis-trans isomerase [Solirubrobacterales bacterium]
MDRRVITLIVAAAVAVALVAVVLIAQNSGGGSSGGGSGDITDTSTKPDVEVPSGAPPKTLVKKEVVVGDGSEAKPGDTVKVQYVGVLYNNGKQFDASWDRNQPFSFQLGGGQVIPGWDQGVEGMRVGGRRELIIPPDLGYGAQGAPPDIPPNATLVFVIDLLAVQ